MAPGFLVFWRCQIALENDLFSEDEVSLAFGSAFRSGPLVLRSDLLRLFNIGSQWVLLDLTVGGVVTVLVGFTSFMLLYFGL